MASSFRFNNLVVYANTVIMLFVAKRRGVTSRAFLTLVGKAAYGRLELPDTRVPADFPLQILRNGRNTAEIN